MYDFVSSAVVFYKTKRYTFQTELSVTVILCCTSILPQTCDTDVWRDGVTTICYRSVPYFKCGEIVMFLFIHQFNHMFIILSAHLLPVKQALEDDVCDCASKFERSHSTLFFGFGNDVTGRYLEI